MMKIFTVTFNDGGWHQSLPNYMIVAKNEEEAIEIALEKNPRYKNGYDSFAIEFKVQGYIIEVYDERTYNREKNLDKLI